ncbi:hypothetical protein [Vibrio alginolyticus]|uniref:hypothetical protein n=1 Tax=Vibrio alginolyticus TaxID=663 RepID=UPI0015F38962|nr:hypothetical protein [Vibrio alginolyticus]
MKEDTNTDYFKLCMEAVVNSDIGANSIGGDTFADEQLLIASKTSMSSKLRKGRKNGRHGWWTPEVCSVEELYKLREKALAEDDHISTLNYTSMIAMRQSIESDGK